MMFRSTLRARLGRNAPFCLCTEVRAPGHRQLPPFSPHAGGIVELVLPKSVQLAYSRCPAKQQRQLSLRASSRQLDQTTVEDVLDSLCNLADRRATSLDEDATSTSLAAGVNPTNIDIFITSTTYSLASLSNKQLAKCIRGLGLCSDAVDTLWLTNFVEVSRGRLQLFTATELAQIIWGLSELDHDPGQEWLDTFLAASQSQLQDFYSPHLCDLIWGLACNYRAAGRQLPLTWVAAFMEESGYQLQEFASDFSGLDLAKLINGLAYQRAVCHLDDYPGWIDGFMKSAYLRNIGFGEAACINQSLANMGSSKKMLHRDSRCTYEEASGWLPRHERDMRRIHKNYKAPQWSGY